MEANFRAKVTKCKATCSTNVQLSHTTECNMGDFTGTDPSKWVLKNGAASGLDCAPPPPTEEPTTPPSGVCDRALLPQKAGGHWQCVVQEKWNQWRCGFVCDGDTTSNFLHSDIRAFCKLNKDKWFTKGSLDSGKCWKF